MLYQTLTIPLPSQAYPVYIGRSLLGQRELFERHIKGWQVLIVTQQNLANLYLNDLLRTLSTYQCDVLILPQGEKYKNLQSWRKILDYLVAKGHERSTTLLALGGGMIGDLTGFAAATYQRGVNYIQIPSTVIAQVDSAIGGKTGVNHPAGKNLIGAVHQPLCILADISLLKTLPKRQWIAGFAEVIKSALIQDAIFFAWLENNLEALLRGEEGALLHAIYTTAGIKGQLIAQDEHDQKGLRALLNFGHTFGHAIEAASHYRSILHGEAVAIGVALASRLSMGRDWLTEKDYQRILNILTRSALPKEFNETFNLEAISCHLLRDKKVKKGRLNWVLLKKIGQAVLTDEVDQEEVLKLIVHPPEQGDVLRKNYLL